jgi:hypothetical protein
LTLSGSTLTYTFGGKTLNQSITKDGLNDLFIRARGTAEDSVVLSELKFLDATNTQILQGQLSSVSAHGNGGPNAGYLRISGGGLASGFTLSGKMAFSWSGSAPSGSNLIGQFKLGTNPDVAAVPEPSTLALAASSVVPVCLVAVRRIRRRRAGLD